MNIIVNLRKVGFNEISSHSVAYCSVITGIFNGLMYSNRIYQEGVCLSNLWYSITVLGSGMVYAAVVLTIANIVINILDHYLFSNYYNPQILTLSKKLVGLDQSFKNKEQAQRIKNIIGNFDYFFYKLMTQTITCLITLNSGMFVTAILVNAIISCVTRLLNTYVIYKELDKRGISDETIEKTCEDILRQLELPSLVPELPLGDGLYVAGIPVRIPSNLLQIINGEYFSFGISIIELTPMMAQIMRNNNELSIETALILAETNIRQERERLKIPGIRDMVPSNLVMQEFNGNYSAFGIPISEMAEIINEQVDDGKSIREAIEFAANEVGIVEKEKRRLENAMQNPEIKKLTSELIGTAVNNYSKKISEQERKVLKFNQEYYHYLNIPFIAQLTLYEILVTNSENTFYWFMADKPKIEGIEEEYLVQFKELKKRFENLGNTETYLNTIAVPYIFKLIMYNESTGTVER